MKNRLIDLTFFTMLLLAVTFAGCDNSPAKINGNGASISGKIANAANLQLFLDQTEFDNSNMVIAKADISGNDKFSISLEEGFKPGVYRLRIGAKKANLILDGTESDITINGELATFDKYQFEVEGSNAAKEFVTSMNQYLTKNDKAALISYIKSTPNSIGAAFATWRYLSNDLEQVPLLKEVKAKLVSAHPDSKYTTDYKTVVNSQEAKYAAMKAKELVQLGYPAPDIELENPDGKKMALSDLKGKIVLLDFWASWCGPCRKANPHVVETYKKYKDRGFTVYSVSLDGINPRLRNKFKTEDQISAQLEKAKQKWVAAIEKDNLIWDTHVSDLQHWNSIAAKMYGVRSIPQTFLIDRDGNLAAMNPRNNLEEEILKLL